MLPIVTHKYLDIVRKRGEAKAKLEKVYKNMQDRELFLMAYGQIYANKGALTPGVNPDDPVDGMSLKRIDAILEKLKKEEYRWTAVRRTYIAKKNTAKLRPLGLPITVSYYPSFK